MLKQNLAPLYIVLKNEKKKSRHLLFFNQKKKKKKCSIVTIFSNCSSSLLLSSSYSTSPKVRKYAKIESKPTFLTFAKRTKSFSITTTTTSGYALLSIFVACDNNSKIRCAAHENVFKCLHRLFGKKQKGEVLSVVQVLRSMCFSQ